MEMEWNTIDNITTFVKEDRKFSLEELFRLLYIVIKDVQDYNEKKMIEFDVNDDKELMLSIQRVLERTLKAANDNKSRLVALSKRGADELKSIIENAQRDEEELKKLTLQLDDIGTKRDKMREQAAEMEKERGYLLKAQEDLKNYSEIVDKLSDSHLDGMDKERDRVKKDAEIREERERELRDEIYKLERLKQETDDKLVELEKAKKELEDTINSSEARKQEIKDIIDRLEIEGNGLEELSAQYAVIMNAFNSMIKENATINNVFGCESDDNNIFTIETGEDSVEVKSVEDILKWMNTMQTRIEKDISVYKEQYCRLVKASSFMSNEKENENV